MNNFNYFSKKLKHSSCYLHGYLLSLLHILFFQLNPFWLELGYFITLSSFGFLALKSTNPRLTSITSLNPNNMDLFFTSVSATTVSSMSTIEMEVFSNTQLVFLTIFMFAGGEVFTSMLGLYLIRAKMNRKAEKSLNHQLEPDAHIELGTIRVEKSDTNNPETETKSVQEYNLKLKSVRILAYLVFIYLLVVHVVGSTLVSIYLSLIPGAKKVLKTKGINLETFSVFTTASTFSNCGFVPTNENMMVFRGNPGLLLILIPQVLMGNTMFPVCLRLSIWFAEKMTRREEFGYMLRNSRELGYGHLIPGLHCVFLGITVLGFVFVQVVVFCTLEWNSEDIGVGGLSVYEKVVGFMFEVVNSRHAGESVFDLSAVSPAILVLFVLMML